MVKRKTLNIGRQMKGILVNNFHYILLFLMIVIYSTILSIVSINNYNRFYYSAFDIGIFDQGIWLLSQGKDPFVTVRGLHLFGDHIQFISIFVAPLFWIWDNARVLLILQSVALALGAVPLYLITKEKIKSKWIPLIFVFSYFLYPSLHYLNLENFHLVSLGVPILLFAFYFLMKKNYKLFLIFVGLTLITREELVLTVLAMGIYAFFKCDRKIGIITILSSLVWLFLIFNVIFPHYTPFVHPNLRRGGNIFGSMQELVTNPKTISTLNTEENRKYFFDIFSPVAFISFLNPQTLFLALPALGINLITTWPYAHSIQYHYTYAIIPFVFISVVYSFSFLKDFLFKRESVLFKKIFYMTLIIFIIFSLVGNNYLGPNSTSIRSNSIIETIKNFNHFNEQEKARYEAVSMIPEDATVSATYLFVPHISHRKIIYMFPNPFKEAYWGAELGNFTPPTPTKDVDYIILDDTLNEFEEKNVVKPLLEQRQYSVVFEKNYIRVLQRNVSAS
jgi:uncharacterized membrane protein